MTKSGLVILIAALVAGVAIGYVAGNSGGTGMPDDPEIMDAPRKPDAEREWRERPPTSSSGSSNSLEAAIDGIRTERYEGGDGTITGTVKTAAGTPLADVLIRASSIKDRGSRARDSSGSPPDEKDLADAVRDLVESRRRDRALRRETMTDAEGRYEVKGLNDSDYYIRGYKKGWSIAGFRGRSSYKVKAGKVVDFTAKPLVGIPVEILMPDGTTPKAAWIEAKQGNNSRSHPWSTEHPTLHLSPGDYQLTAVAGDDQEMKSEKVDVVLETGQIIDPMTFELIVRPGIKGTVVFPEGAGNQNAQVKAIRVAEGADPDPENLKRAQKHAWVYVSHSKFTFTDLEAGTWLVGVVQNYQEVIVHKTVEVSEGFAEVELTMPIPKPEDSINVRVEGPDGKLLSDVRITAGVMTQHGPMNFGMGQSATRLEDGTWRVPHGTVPPGWGGETDTKKGYIEATSGKYGSKRVEYTKGTDTSITLRFDDPASLVVTLGGYRGSPYEGTARIGLEPLSRTKRSGMGFSSYAQKGPDKDGAQEFKPVAPGEYKVNVFIQGADFGQRLAHSEEVTIKAGENRVTLSLPGLYRLVVIVPAVEEGTQARYQLSPRQRRDGFWVPPGKKDEQNRVTFDMISAGDYIFSIYGGRSQQKMYVTVPGPEVVRFAAQVFNAMAVEIEDASGTLAASGLKHGDLVIGANGEEFENETQMRAQMMLARTKTSTKLIVLRGRKKIELVVDLTAAQGPKAGGRMTSSTR